MKITDVKPFVSTDRQVHVALNDERSKDGFVSLVKKADPDGNVKTFVSVKSGGPGRPLVVSASAIDSITWHSAGVKSATATKTAPKKGTKSTKPHSRQVADKVLADKAPKGAPVRTKGVDKALADTIKAAKSGLTEATQAVLSAPAKAPGKPAQETKPTTATIVTFSYKADGKEMVTSFVVATDDPKAAQETARKAVFEKHSDTKSVKLVRDRSGSAVLL